MKTICLCVGVSEYQDPAFEQLPGAQADAGRFATSLASWGMPSDWIYLHVNAKATKANIIKAFYDCRPSFDKEAKFIFYFAGHGVREKYLDQCTHESSLVLYDTRSNDALATGLRLIELMQLIRSLRPSQVFLFIDACSLRLNQIENPLNDVEVFSTTNSTGFFCMFSSGVHKSYECQLFKYGYFTNALLKAISDLRQKKHVNCHDIVRRVSDSLRKQSLHVPEVYHIGSDEMWPLEKSYMVENNLASKDANALVQRWEALAVLQDHLVSSPDPIIWMWGEGGKGKTIIVEQLCQRNDQAIYVSIPSASKGSIRLIPDLIDQIRSQKSELFFNRPPDLVLAQCLDYLGTQHPESTLILDHLDRLQESDLQSLLASVDRISLPTILVSRNPCPRPLFEQRQSQLLEWQAAPFSVEEIEQILAANGLDSSFSTAMLNASNGNVLKIRQMVVKLTSPGISFKGEGEEDYIKSIAAIVSCGGFLDEFLFCRIFKLKSNTLDRLQSLGLIRYTKEGCFPHDILVDLVDENQWTLEFNKACSYWSIQIQQTPYNRWACRSLVILASQLSTCKPYKKALRLCLETLNEREYVIFLIDLIKIFKREDWVDLLLKSTDYLLIHEEYKLCGEILAELLNSNKPSIKRHAIRNEARRLVWVGYYNECLMLETDEMKKCRSLEFRIPFTNSLAISHFSLGNFNESQRLFKIIIKYSRRCDEREFGIAKYYMGLIMTFHGEDIVKTKKIFESSLQIFESTKYYVYTLIGLNGLADLYYRTDQWHQALAYLKKAEEIGKALRHQSFLLFTWRNIARVLLRLFGPNNYELLEIVERIEELLKQLCQQGDNWVILWAKNTLATIYAHCRDIKKMRAVMQEIRSLNVGFKETRVYTLSNLGHLAALTKDYSEAKKYYREAFLMCKQMNYDFALNEIKQDFKGCAFPLELMHDAVLTF